MKRRAILAAVFVGASFLLFSLVGAARGQSFQTGTSINVPKTKTIDGSFYTAGRTLDIAGTINGDLFCAGQNITISGIITGDVICAGQNIHVTGLVNGDVRSAGQNVTISGHVAHSATVAAQSFTLDSGGKIGGDLSASAGDVNINGSVARDSLLNGRDVTVSNVAGRDIRANVDKLSLGPSANVGGKLDYTSSNQANIEPGSKIKGKITRTTPTPHSRKYGVPVAVTFVWALYMFLSLLLLSIVLALLFPRAFDATTEQGVKHPWRSVLVGVVAFFAAPLLFIALMLTVVGMPLAFLFGLSWLLTLLLSGPFFAYYVGRRILQNSRMPVLIMLVGAAVVLAVYLIPILGAFALMIAIIMGSGMLIVEAFGRVPKPTHPIKRVK